MNTMFKHEVVHKCTWYQAIVVSSDLWQHVLESWLKEEEEEQSCQLITSWI